MRTYISPIGYDTRRVTRPVISRGIEGGDELVMLRPNAESDTERANQTIADVKQYLHEAEPAFEISVERVETTSFEETVRDCCRLLGDIEPDRETIVSLGGGARDILLPLTVASLVYANQIDTALFFSDLDSTVREWTLPDLTTQVPDRTTDTLAVILEAGGWITLSEIVSNTSHSKSTVVRHVNDLEEAGVIQADTSEKAKRVRATFSGEMLSMA